MMLTFKPSDVETSGSERQCGHAVARFWAGRRFFAVSLLLLLLTACGSGYAAVTPTSPPFPTSLPPTQRVDVTPVPLILTPIESPERLPSLPPLTDMQSSKSLALVGERLVTVNTDSRSVTLLDMATDTVTAEIQVGADPRTVTITPDGTRALVTLRGDNALAVVNLETQQLEATYPVCHMPYGVVTDGRRVFVSCFADDQIAVLGVETGDELYRLNVVDAPAGVALSGDWLLVTHFYQGEVTVINVQRTPVVVGAVDVEPDGYLGRVLVAAPDGQRVYIPQTRSGLALVSVQFMQDWFPVVTVLDVATMTGNRDERITISMIGEYAANMPFDVAFSADGQTLYTVLAGNDAVEVIDLEAYTVTKRIPVGANPRGIVIEDERAFVLNALAGTVSVIDLAQQQVVNTIAVTDIPLDSQLLRGKVLYHRAAAPTMSDGAISCATCHFDGGMDARTWINFRSGPRNTLALGGIEDLPPYHWAGEMAELHDATEDVIRIVMSGDGLIEDEYDSTIDRIDAGRSEDLDALAAYVASLEPWPSPYREPDGSLSESAERGMMLFMSGSPSCSCHAPPLYTDLQQHNLAGVAFSMEVFDAFDTPSLRGIWATGPYMHDGVAQTLEEVLTRTDPVHSVADKLTEQQLADLIAFLLSL